MNLESPPEAIQSVTSVCPQATCIIPQPFLASQWGVMLPCHVEHIACFKKRRRWVEEAEAAVQVTAESWHGVQ